MGKRHDRLPQCKTTAVDALHFERDDGHFKMQCCGDRPSPFCNHGNRRRRDFARDPDKRGPGMADASSAGMKDLILIGVTVAFFAVSWLYVKSFDRI